ncbi:MAG: DsbA family oxidoreductase [Acidimicrobiia bacterium]
MTTIPDVDALAPEPLRVDVWSDVVCPWCAIGKANLEQAVVAFDRPVEVVWHSYELDPTAPAARAGDYVGMIAKKYGTTPEQAQVMVDRVVQAGAEAGVEFRFDRVQPGNTFDAHRMIQLGNARGIGPQVKARFLRGYFVDGEAIGLPEVVTRLAVDAGLDPDEVEAVLTTDTFAEEVRTDEAMAASLQVTGVPFFVVDRRYAVAGAQSADTMLQVLERAAAERDADAIEDDARDTAPDPGGGACDIDGC